jgi:hypothetical protein
VQKVKSPAICPGRPNPARIVLATVIEDPHDLVAAVGNVHELLAIVRREVDVPRGAGGPDSWVPVPGMTGMAWRRKLPSRRVDIDPILAAIACVHEPVGAEDDAVRMATTTGG